MRPGLRRSASQRLTSLSHFSKPRFGTSSSVSRRPAAIVSADQQRVAGDDGRQEDADGTGRAEPTGHALGRRSGRGLEDRHAARLLRLAGRRRRGQRGERYDLGRRVRRIHAGLFTQGHRGKLIRRCRFSCSRSSPLAGGILVTLLALRYPDARDRAGAVGGGGRDGGRGSGQAALAAAHARPQRSIPTRPRDSR